MSANKRPLISFFKEVHETRRVLFFLLSQYYLPQNWGEVGPSGTNDMEFIQKGELAIKRKKRHANFWRALICEFYSCFFIKTTWLIDCMIYPLFYFFKWWHDLNPQPYGCHTEYLPVVLHALAITMIYLCHNWVCILPYYVIIVCPIEEHNGQRWEERRTKYILYVLSIWCWFILIYVD